MLGSFRAQLRGFTRFVAKPFAALGIPPNAFSFSGAILAVIAAYFIMRQDFVPASIFAVLAVSIDLFDGAVAELQNRKSLFGNYFETMVDKFVETILFVSTAFIHPIAAVFALGASMLTGYAKPRVGLVIITDNRDWPSIGEHSERMLLLILGLILSVFSVQAFGFPILELALWLIAAISLIGLIQRVFFAKKLIKEAEAKGNVLPYLRK